MNGSLVGTAMTETWALRVVGLTGRGPFKFSYAIKAGADERPLSGGFIASGVLSVLLPAAPGPQNRHVLVVDVMDAQGLVSRASCRAHVLPGTNGADAAVATVDKQLQNQDLSSARANIGVYAMLTASLTVTVDVSVHAQIIQQYINTTGHPGCGCNSPESSAATLQVRRRFGGRGWRCSGTCEQPPPPPPVSGTADPQRVGTCSGERPMGAAKGKQPNTEALCQPPRPPEYPRTEDVILKKRTNTHTRRYQPTYSLSVDGTPSGSGPYSPGLSARFSFRSEHQKPGILADVAGVWREVSLCMGRCIGDQQIHRDFGRQSPLCLLQQGVRGDSGQTLVDLSTPHWQHDTLALPQRTRCVLCVRVTCGRPLSLPQPVGNCLLKGETGVRTQKYQPAHLLSCCGSHPGARPPCEKQGTGEATHRRVGRLPVMPRLLRIARTGTALLTPPPPPRGGRKGGLQQKGHSGTGEAWCERNIRKQPG